MSKETVLNRILEMLNKITDTDYLISIVCIFQLSAGISYKNSDP